VSSSTLSIDTELKNLRGMKRADFRRHSLLKIARVGLVSRSLSGGKDLQYRALHL